LFFGFLIGLGFDLLGEADDGLEVNICLFLFCLVLKDESKT
jgi:hypothetical protein